MDFLWIIATFVAYFVKGLSGFANTLVLTSILGFGSNNVNISPVELVVGFPSNIYLTWNNRKNLKPRIIIPLALMTIVGSIPGAFLLKHVNAAAIKVVFGVLIILIGIEMLLRNSGKLQIKESKIFLFIIGLLSGVFCGLFGVGALLAAYVGRFAKNSSEFKANMCAVFVVENAFRIILYSVIGVITWSSLKMSLILIPFMALGIFAGTRSSSKLKDKTVMTIVDILLILSGVSLIILNV
ncbi:MAG: sulfite exporter TauE/SafE family protein [Saccharofermentans sp.]|nr:sulfite exporter TauE/SafE family protein [Saccharofermentans sp.]